MRLIKLDEKQDFLAVLQRNGLAASDFELLETDTTDPKGDENFGLQGYVTVTRLSTQVTREYPIGYETDWVHEMRSCMPLGRQVKDDHLPNWILAWKTAYPDHAHVPGRTTSPATLPPVFLWPKSLRWSSNGCCQCRSDDFFVAVKNGVAGISIHPLRHSAAKRRKNHCFMPSTANR